MKPATLFLPVSLAVLIAILAEVPARARVSPELEAAGLTVIDTATGRPANVRVPRTPAPSNCEVSQRGGVFVPDRITLRPRRPLRIQNDDTTVHHAFCQTKEFRFTSGSMAPGSDVTIQFPTPGTYEIRCAIHPKMMLVVTVEGD